MPEFKLKTDDIMPPNLGMVANFHRIDWGGGCAPASVRAGGNLNHHQFASATMPHSHEFAEVILVVDGKLNHEVNGENIELERGDLVFIRPSDTHCFAKGCGSFCELTVFSFSLELLMDLNRYYNHVGFMRGFTAPPLPPSMKISAEKTDRLTIAMLEVGSLQFTNPERAALKGKAVIAEIFAEKFIVGGRADGGNHPAWFEKVDREMREPANFAVGLPRLLKIAGRSQEHVCKTFRKYRRQTPTEFINELRVTHAARLLADTDEEIYAIAIDCGFQSLSRFYSLFKRRRGVTPAQFRKTARRATIPA